MSNTVEFILRLKDMMSGTMAKATSAAQRGLGNTTRSVASLERAMRMLERKRNLSIDTREISRANSQIERLQTRINSLRGGSGGSGGGGGMMGSFVGGNLIAGAISQGIGFIKDQAVDTFKTSLRMDGLRTAINSTTGGQGKQAVAITSSISDKYGLNYEASLEGVKTLTGGLKSMNMPLAEQMKIFEGVSTGIAAMKLGAEESKGAMLALGQMASKGTVSAEELRGQLGERIPGAFGIAAKAMNVTEAQLGKMMQKGEIAAKDFLPAFAAEMQKTFGADALAAAKGPQAIMERYNNSILKMKDSIGTGLMPLLTPLVEAFTTLSVSVMPYIQTAIDWIVAGVESIKSGTSEWSGYFGIVKEFAGHVWSAIKKVSSLVWSVGKGVIEWVRQSQLLQDIMSGAYWVFGKIFDIVGGIADKIKWLWEKVIKPILDGIEKAYQFVKGLLGFDNTIKFQHSFSGQLPFVPQNGAGAKKGVPLVTMNGFAPGASVFGKSGGTKSLDTLSKGGAEGVTSGGPKTITININKEMIGSLAINSFNVKEGVGELEDKLQEMIYRMFYSLKSAQ